MDDTISRRAAIDAFDGVKVDEENCTEYDIGYNDGIDFAISKLSVLPPAQPEKRTEERTKTHACDSISRQETIEKILGQPPEPHYPSWYAEQIKELPPAEPKRETTTLRIGRTRNSVTMWYECAECGEPVDQEDAFCRRCGREIIHE